jgi:PAS domain S-box-containing protein
VREPSRLRSRNVPRVAVLALCLATAPHPDSSGAPAPPSSLTALRPPADPALLPVRTVAQARTIPREESTLRRIPAEIEGTVTFVSARWKTAFVQDATAGIFFQGLAVPEDLAPGEQIRILGWIGTGRFAPILEVTNLVRLGRKDLPPARPPDPGRLVLGGEDAQRIELSGTVRHLTVHTDMIVWNVAGDLGAFHVLFPGNRPEDLSRAADWLGAEVRLRGVCGSDFSPHDQFLGYKLLVNGAADVERLSPAPADPFGLPLTPLGRLQKFDPASRPGRLVHLAGTVTWSDGERRLQIQDDHQGVPVHLAEGHAPPVGTQVDIIGFVAFGRPGASVEYAHHRATGTAAVPAPRAVRLETLDPAHDNLLVTGEAVYLDAGRRGTALEIGLADATGRHLTAWLPHADGFSAGFEAHPGSLLRLTGVYRLLPAASGEPAEYRLLLRGPKDIQILSPASWWTRERATVAASVLAAIVLGGLAWTGLLGRRLRRQQHELDVRMDHQTALEHRHRELTEGAPDAIFTLDAQGRIHSANLAATTLIGYRDEELRQMRIFEVLPPDQRSRAATRIAERFQLGGTGQPLLIEMVNRAGHRRIVEVTSRLLNPPDGPPLLEGVARDVTDRKRAEDALKTLAAMTALGGGGEFCRSVTRQVAELLGMRFASVSTLVPGHPHRLRTLAFFAGGEFDPDFEYPVEGSPCQHVVGQRECFFPRDARRLFPMDQKLTRLGVECYLGLPLWDSRNEPVGVLTLMHTQPFEPTPAQFDMLRVLAARTGAEIERLAATEALRTSEERFRQLAEQSEDVLWVLDLQPLRLAYVGAPLSRLAGLPVPAAGPPPSLRRLLSLVHPDDRPRLLDDLRRPARDTTGRYSLEFRIVRADGGVRWILDQGVALRDASGHVIRISGVARDITARKEAEIALAAERSRFHELFENSPDAVFVESTEGRVLAVNRAASDLHRMPRERIVGRHFSELVPQDSREEAGNAFQRLLSGETNLVEGFSLRSDGSSLPVELRATRFLDGDQTALLIHVRDVTLRKAAETFLGGQKRILEWIATARPVGEILAELVRIAEARSPGVRCWVHWYPDEAVPLPWIAAPSFDGEAVAALRLAWQRGEPLEDTLGRSEPSTMVLEPSDDPATEGALTELARRLGGGAIVATGILSPSGRRLGAFATLCPPDVRPAGPDLDVNRLAASLAAMAIDRHLTDAALRESAERLQTANSALLALARSDALSSGDLAAALEEITEAASRSIGVARVSVWLLEEQDTVLRCLHEFDPSAPSGDHPHEIHLEGHQAYFEAITRERQITVHDVDADPRTAPMARELLAPLGIRSLLDAGIRLRGRLAGVICMEHRGTARTWKTEEELIAASLADIVAMALQASERRCIEEALRQSEEAYRSVVGALAEGVILVSRDGTFLTFNESAADILGVPTAQLVNRRLTDDAWQLFRPDGGPFDSADHPAIVTLRSGQPATDCPLGVRRPDGKIAWLSVNTRPFNRDATGEVASVVVSFTDVTRRQEAERALREGNALLQAITDTQARFIADSAADRTLDRMLATLAGMTESRHGLLAEISRSSDGPPALALYPPSGGPEAVPPHRQAAIDALVAQVLATGRAGFQTLAAPPTESEPASTSAVSPPAHHLLALPLRHEDEVVGIVCLGRPTEPYGDEITGRLEPLLVTCANLLRAIRTDRRRELAEAQIRQLNAELELRVERRTADLQAINQELAEFAYVVTHDLKAPLRGIHQLSEWLAQDHASQLDASGLRLLSLLRQRVHHLQQLIDGLLACARVGRSPEPERKVQTRDLVKQVLAVLAPPAHVRIHVAEDLPAIEGNPDRLHQVFQNLLDNAVKYLDKPHGRIGVTAVREKGGWIFRIADNGPGIPARYRDKVFQIFQRLHQTAEIPGTGLGLTLVKRIVENRGGRIWIESEDGLGTTVCFGWPDEGRQRIHVFGTTAPLPGNGNGPTPLGLAPGPAPGTPPTSTPPGASPPAAAPAAPSMAPPKPAPHLATAPGTPLEEVPTDAS